MTANLLISRELQNLKSLERQTQSGLSSNYVAQLLDAFPHKGPNVVHQCLVFELLSPSVDKVLSDYHESHDKLHPETVLRISTQLLKAVKFIYSAGMCHGGEVASSAVVFYRFIPSYSRPGRSKWESMQMTSSHNLELEEGN